MRTLLGAPSLDFMYINASAPGAPPLSETTIGCFIRLFFWIAACIMRAIWSEAPPAPAATTISTGFVGSQAATGALASASAKTTLVVFANVFISLILLYERTGDSGLYLCGAPLRRRCRLFAGFLQITQCVPHAILLVRNPARGKSHLDAAQRSAQHEVVEKAQMPDPEDAPRKAT